LGRPLRKDGLMTVPVTTGSHTIAVQWAATRDVIAGRVLNALALLGLVGTVLLEHRAGNRTGQEIPTS
jgi:hypothetical protein